MTSIYAPFWLSPIADWLSLIAFVITLWVLRTTLKLRKEFGMRVRTPELRKALSEELIKLAPTLKLWETSKHPALEVIAAVTAQLKSLALKSTDSEKAAIESLISKYAFRSTVWNWHRARPIQSYSAEEIWATYFELIVIIETAKQSEMDANWIQP